MRAHDFRKGLHDLGGGLFAYLQPDGSWGYSNAGLVTDGDASLLVDTLFDMKLTEAMLAAMRDATPAARRIDQLVNTHANGDHCYGNAAVGDARIIASRASAEEMDELPPAQMAALVRSGPELGVGGAFLARIFGAFDFEGIAYAPPTETFSEALTLTVGDKQVDVFEVGPAHTRGDVLVHVPDDDVIFTGDILFIEGTPIMWAGPVDGWLRACDRIVELAPRTIVPGHGPLTDVAGVRRMQAYLEFVRDAARARFEAGLSAAEAAREIARDLGEYRHWLDRERIVVNVHTLYREFSGGADGNANVLEIFGQMAELAERARGDGD